MNYKQTLEFIYSKTPSLDKKGWGAYKPGLERAHQQMEVLGDPHKSLKFIHVAGTNGKGSVCSMLASVLQAAGYKIGLFTSPHLLDFRERIRVNGESISEQEVVDFVAEFSSITDNLDPSFFEYTFAMAIWYFQQQKVDYVVLETGLGGRLDCTNVVTPIVSVITSIGLDHQQFLGDTIEKIAKEKAGIIKEDVPFVSGVDQPSAQGVIDLEANRINAPNIPLGNFNLYESDLKGACQTQNQITVRTVIAGMKDFGEFENVEDDHVRFGLANVIRSTALVGRFQKLQDNPLVFCDVAHNEDGVEQLMRQLRSVVADEIDRKLHIVWGVSADKSLKEVFKLLPKEALYYWCKSSNARAMEAGDLFNLAMEYDLIGQKVKGGVSEAYDRAVQAAGRNDVILIGGSVFVVADLFSSKQNLLPV